MNQQCWIARRVQELRRHDGTLNRLSGFIALRHSWGLKGGEKKKKKGCDNGSLNWTYDSLSRRSCQSSRAFRHTATRLGRTSHLRTWSFQGCCTLWWSCSPGAAGSLFDEQIKGNREGGTRKRNSLLQSHSIKKVNRGTLHFSDIHQHSQKSLIISIFPEIEKY